jgi:hypothetical protein
MKTRSTSRKPSYNRSVRLNISLPPLLDSRKAEIVQRFGFPDFSGYIQARMRKDLGIELTA